LSPRTLALGGIVLLAALLIGLPFADPIIQRIVFLVQREAGLISTTGRTAIWAHLIAYVPDRPWFGFGLNNASALVPILPSMNGGAFVFNTPTAESAYVAALVETGIVGFVALLAFIGVILWRAIGNVRAVQTPAIHIGVLAATVAILCGNLTVAGLTTDQNGMLLGALIGLLFSSPVTRIINDRIIRVL
jgi:O-antigen ligase